MNPRIIPANTRVMPFAQTIGISWLKMPYINHRKVPLVNTAYMEREIPVVFFVLMVFKAWGKKEMVVQNAAARPSRVTNFIKETLALQVNSNFRKVIFDYHR